MLTEKQIKALKNGAYGITRFGNKVLYLRANDDGFHEWLFFGDQGREPLYINNEYVSFDKFLGEGDTASDDDIVGLWDEYIEPFDLERALKGGNIINALNNKQAVIVGKSIFADEKESYVIEYWNGDIETFPLDFLNRYFLIRKMSEHEHFMNEQLTNQLPKPIRDFGDLEEVWFVDIYDVKYIPQTSIKARGWDKYQCEALKNNCYYATKEDCQAVCDWLMSR